MSNQQSNEEQDYWNASERHHQIMLDGKRFFNRVVYGILFVIVTACGFLYFFLKGGS